MASVLRYILPLSSILFLVVGLVFLGIATPSEAAAVGCVGCFVLAFAYRRFNWIVFKKSMAGTIRISGMLLMIMVGCVGFSQILAFTGATSGLVEMTTKFPLPPIFIIILMLIVLLIMGTFMEAITIMMITMPIYMPIIRSFGFEPLWFGVLFLVSIETGGVTPPFGLLIFILKGVIPDSPNISMGDLYRAGIPFILCNAIVITLILLFPFLATWLPGLML
jgi:tripartite ATP-independent transporter DctM subunit